MTWLAGQYSTVSVPSDVNMQVLSIGAMRFAYRQTAHYKRYCLFIQREQSVFCLDGLILNAPELASDREWEDFVCDSMQVDLPSFVSTLRGSFTGFYYQGQRQILRVFNDQLGDRPLFYSPDAPTGFSDDFSWLRRTLLVNRSALMLNGRAVRMMCTYGGMLNTETFICQINRLWAGQIGTYADSHFAAEFYHRFDSSNAISGISDEEWIERLDSCFQTALRRMLNLASQQNEMLWIDISGGLDSRTIAFAIKKMGFPDARLISYAQFDSNEEIITRQVVRALPYPFIFTSLDDAGFLLTPEDTVQDNWGLTYYAGITGGRRMLACLNHSCCRLEINGLLGDMYEGSFSSIATHERPKPPLRYKINSNMEDDPSIFVGADLFANNEIYTFYTRGLLFGLGTQMIRRRYNESFSPFMDVDFIDLSFSIPLEERLRNHIFRKWLIRCYPEAAAIPYDKTMTRINMPDWQEKICRRLRVSIPAKVHTLTQKTRLNEARSVAPRNTMNPFDYWYRTNEKIRTFLDSYIAENIHLLSAWPELYDEVKNQPAMSAMNKTLLISALASIKIYSPDNLGPENCGYGNQKLDSK